MKYEIKEKKYIKSFQNNYDRQKKNLEQKQSQQIQNKNVLVYVPKCLILFSKKSYFGLQRTLLKQFHKNALYKDYAQISEHKMREVRQKIQQKYYVTQLCSNKFTSQQRSKEVNKIRIQIQNEYLCQFYSSFFFIPQMSNRAIAFSHQNEQYYYEIPNSSFFFFPHEHLYETICHLGVSNVMKLWKCLLLQKQIIIFSADNFTLINTCQVFLPLLEPLKWEGSTYIPYLPFQIHYYANAVGGTLIGMSKHNMDYIISQYTSEDKVFVDYQNKKIWEINDNQIQLPLEIQQFISLRLEAMLKYQQNQNIRTILIKKIFFQSLLFLFNNYLQFVQEQKHKKNFVFDRKGFVNMFDKDWKPFEMQFCRTMMFVQFCSQNSTNEIEINQSVTNLKELFIYCHNLLKKQIKNGFWRPKLMNNSQRHKNPTAINYVFIYDQDFKRLLNKDLKNFKQNKSILSMDQYFIKYVFDIKADKNIMVRRQQKKQSFLSNLIGRCFSRYDQQQRQSCLSLQRSITMKAKNLLNFRKLIDENIIIFNQSSQTKFNDKADLQLSQQHQKNK